MDGCSGFHVHSLLDTAVATLNFVPMPAHVVELVDTPS